MKERDVQIALKNLTVGRSGRPFVSALDLELFRGSFVAVTGPSGAGKTSLLECLAGLLEPMDGSIEFHDPPRPAASPAEFRTRISLIFQHLRLTPNASVETNALCGALGRHAWWRTLFGFPKPERERAAAILEQLGIAHYSRDQLKHISGGEKQRVAIARALMQNPDVLLADEPVSSLDHDLARSLLGKLREESRDRKRTIICVLHDLRLADEFADVTLNLDATNPAGWTLERKTA